MTRVQHRYPVSSVLSYIAQTEVMSMSDCPRIQLCAKASFVQGALL